MINVILTIVKILVLKLCLDKHSSHSWNAQQDKNKSLFAATFHHWAEMMVSRCIVCEISSPHTTVHSSLGLYTGNWSRLHFTSVQLLNLWVNVSDKLKVLGTGNQPLTERAKSENVESNDNIDTILCTWNHLRIVNFAGKCKKLSFSESKLLENLSETKNAQQCCALFWLFYKMSVWTFIFETTWI